MTDAEIWALNVLVNSANNAQGELNRAIAARGAYIELLESKYDATFNETTGQLEPKPKAKKDAIPG